MTYALPSSHALSARKPSTSPDKVVEDLQKRIALLEKKLAQQEKKAKKAKPAKSAPTDDEGGRCGPPGPTADRPPAFLLSMDEPRKSEALKVWQYVIEKYGPTSICNLPSARQWPAAVSIFKNAAKKRGVALTSAILVAEAHYLAATLSANMKKSDLPRKQIAQALRTAAQKLSGATKWDEDGINDAIKEVTTAAMQHDMTPQNFRIKNDWLGWINDSITGPQKKRAFGTPDEPGTVYPSDDKALLKRIETEVKKNLANAPVEASTVDAAAKWVSRGGGVQSLDVVLSYKSKHDGKTRKADTALRLDARDPEKIRLDRYDNLVGVWEAIDSHTHGEGFATEQEAKDFAQKWLAAVKSQGTITPMVKASVIKVQAAKYAVVDFTENPRRGYIVSLHPDQDTAKEKAQRRGPGNLVTFTDRKVGNSIGMDEMDSDDGDEVDGSAKVQAASGVKVEKKGQLKDGIWEGESISFTISLSDFLDELGLKYAAKWVRDGSYEVLDAPDGRELTGYGKKTSSEAITCFPEAASRAYMTAMESGIEAYMAKHYAEGVIDLLNEISGTADYEGEDSNGESAIVKQNYSVTAEETGDVEGIYSDPIIKITIDEPLHLANGPLADLRITSPQNVDEPFKDVSFENDLAAYLQEEFRREVNNIEDVNVDHADMDKDVFDEFFVENVLEMDPGEIAEAIESYASDSSESVEDVVDQMMKDIPGLDKMSGAIAAALEGGYDARQQKLPLKGAAKALAMAEAAIKAAGNPIANIREKRAAAAKRGDNKAVSYWNAKLRNALSKGPTPSSSTKSKAVANVSAARKLTPKQQKKIDDKRIEKAYYKVADGVQINMMDIPKVFAEGEKAIAEGADDAALEKAIDSFVQKIKVSATVTAGRDRLVPFVVKIKKEFGGRPSRDSSVEFKTKQYGRPTDANLAKYVASFNASLEPGGVNEHIGSKAMILEAELVDQRSGETLAVYKMKDPPKFVGF